jgi:O-antigen ligase
MEAYKANGFDFAIRNHRNMHSLYLDIFCCFGIIGLLLFLAGYIVLPVRSAARAMRLGGGGWGAMASGGTGRSAVVSGGVARSGGWLSLAIVLTFATGMIVESYFDRSAGCLLAGFWFCFVASHNIQGHSAGTTVERQQ